MSKDLVKDLVTSNGFEWTSDWEKMSYSEALVRINRLIQAGKIETTKGTIAKTDLSKLESNLKEAKEKEKSIYGKYITTGVSGPDFTRVSDEDLLVKAEEVEELEIDTKLTEAAEKAAEKITPPPTFLQAKRLLNDETAVKKALEFAKLKANPPTNVDVKTLEEKETEYIKNYVENGILGEVDFKQDTDLLIPGAADLVAGVESKEAIDLRGQIEKETEYIKSIVNNVVTGSGLPGEGEPGGEGEPPPGEQTINPNKNQFNNIPEGADLVDVEGQLFLRYAVPGAGELYQGSTLFMFYEVKDNDPVEAGFVTPGQDWFVNAKFSFDDLDLMGVIAGNSADLPGNDPVTGKAPHPFTSFAENLATEAQIAPWILDPDSVALIAEAALEGREVTEAEWFSTNWYKTRNESERSWLREYTKDPLTAKQKANDYKLQVAAALKASGVSGGYDSETNQELGAPDALSSYIANKWVSGQWSESYTTEQLALFADPFRTGVRDQDFTDWIDTAGVGGLNRTAEQEDRIRNLYTQWLGPVFGQLTDSELAEKAGRLRNNPDYEAALIENLKTSRLALFPKYTNTELTYDDIVAPWRGMTRQVWGKEADETEGWWQDMVATNDYEAGQTTLREKGLEQNIGQVTVAATQALQQALGASAGSVEENLGVNQ